MHRLSRFLLIVAVLLTLPQITFAQSTACNQAATEPILEVGLPGHPFRALPTADGCWIFASLQGRPPLQAGIAVLQRTGGKVTLERVVPLETPSAIVLSNDGKLLIVGNGDYVEFLDTARMTSGQGDPKLGRIYGGERATEAYVQVTADDRFVLVSDHGRETISVYKLDQARSSNFKGNFLLGTIPVGRAPLVSIFSPDQKWIYIVSEIASSKSTWPAACGQNPEGVVDVVDVERARTQPDKSVVASVKAGCVPVRLALSPKGDRAYVTARSDNKVLVFDTAKMATDPEKARIATVPVGSTPVGLAVVENGSRIVVTASRGATPVDTQQNLTVIDAARVASGAQAVVGTIPAGNSPRETSPTKDGRTLIINNFNSDSLQLIDLTRLPLKSTN